MTNVSSLSPTTTTLNYDEIGPAVGNRFPDLNLPDQHGNPVNIHETRNGRRELVLFHRSASW